MVDTPGLLLVAHGSRQEAAATELEVLLGHVREEVRTSVAAGWIELRDPPATEAARTLVAGGARQLVIAPLLLFRAHHATADVPAVAAAARAAGAVVAVAEPLGVDDRLVELAVEQVRETADSAPGEGLLVVVTGTSDAGAQAQAATVAEAVAERTGHELARHAFASIAEPGVADAVDGLADAGAERLVVFAWSLLAGRLVSGALHRVEEAALDRGLAVRFAGRFGPAPAVAATVADRYRAAARTLR